MSDDDLNGKEWTWPRAFFWAVFVVALFAAIAASEFARFCQ